MSVFMVSEPKVGSIALEVRAVPFVHEDAGANWEFPSLLKSNIKCLLLSMAVLRPVGLPTSISRRRAQSAERRVSPARLASRIRSLTNSAHCLARLNHLRSKKSSHKDPRVLPTFTPQQRHI